MSDWDALFVEAVAAKLAVKLSEYIRGSSGRTEELIAEYNNIVAPLARRVDGNEGRRRKGMISINSAFVNARWSGV